MQRISTVRRGLAAVLALLSAGPATAAIVSGEIVNAESRPIADARVSAGGQEAVSGADGRFRLTGVAPGEQELEVFHSTYGTAHRQVTAPVEGVLVYLNPGQTDVLAPVTVTGTPIPGDPLLQAAAVDVIQSPEKERVETTSLGDSLAQLAGVNNIGTGNQTGKPVIRGLSGERVRILSDGVGVDHQQYGARHMPTVDPFLAERLEVVRGASSVLYGSSALGGAVNVLPPEIAFDSPLAGETLARYYSNNAQWDTGIKAGGGTGDFGFDAALIRRSAENIETPDEPTFFPPPPSDPDQRDAPAYTGELDYTDFEQLNGQLAAGWRSEALGTWTARYTRWDDEHNFLLPPPAGVKPPSEGAEGIGQYIENDQLQIAGDVRAGGIRWKPKLAWQNNRRRSNAAGTPRNAGFDGAIDIEFDQYTARLAGEHGPAWGLDGGTIGIEYVTKAQVSRGTTQLAPGGNVDNVAVFAFEEKGFGPLLMQAGLRYDYREVQGQASETANPSPAVVNAETNEYSVVTGSLGGTLSLSEHVALAANASRGFRAPTLFELYVQGVHGGVAAFQQGNPDLDEETSLNTDLALRWASPTLRMSATVYRNVIDDYIYTRDTGASMNGLPVFTFDQGKAQLTGVELSVDKQVRPWLALNAAAEAVDGELRGSGDMLPMLPADNVRAGFELTPGAWAGLRRPYLSMDVRYVAAKDAAPGEPFSQFDGAPFGTASTDSYARIDLGGGFAATVLDRVVNVDLAVTNLLDETYRDFLDTYKGYALSPGRDVRVTLRMPFGG